MKYLFTLIVTMSFLSCAQHSANNNASNQPQNRLVKYVNDIAAASPGWDNNNVTKDDFIKKLCKRFNQDIKDSNLLDSEYFTLDQLTNASPGKYVASFKMFDLKAPSVRGNPLDSTEVNVDVFSIIPDSLAKTIKTGALYSLDFSKDKSDTLFSAPSDLYPIDINYSTSTIHYCSLGTHHIQIKKIRPFGTN